MPDATNSAGDAVKHIVANHQVRCDICKFEDGTTYVEVARGRFKIGLSCAEAINTARTA